MFTEKSLIIINAAVGIVKWKFSKYVHPNHTQGGVKGWDRKEKPQFRCLRECAGAPYCVELQWTEWWIFRACTKRSRMNVFNPEKAHYRPSIQAARIINEFCRLGKSVAGPLWCVFLASPSVWVQKSCIKHIHWSFNSTGCGPRRDWVLFAHFLVLIFRLSKRGNCWREKRRRR